MEADLENHRKKTKYLWALSFHVDLGYTIVTLRDHRQTCPSVSTLRGQDGLKVEKITGWQTLLTLLSVLMLILVKMQVSYQLWRGLLTLETQRCAYHRAATCFPWLATVVRLPESQWPGQYPQCLWRWRKLCGVWPCTTGEEAQCPADLLGILIWTYRSNSFSIHL